jgi:hypothetical protein
MGAAVTTITGSPTGGGYWVAAANGSVRAFGSAKAYGTLAADADTPAEPIIAIVQDAGTTGYWLLGSDGGIFAFGAAPYDGSLPAIGVHVTDIVAAVPN